MSLPGRFAFFDEDIYAHAIVPARVEYGLIQVYFTSLLVACNSIQRGGRFYLVKENN